MARGKGLRRWLEALATSCEPVTIDSMKVPPRLAHTDEKSSSSEVHLHERSQHGQASAPGAREAMPQKGREVLIRGQQLDEPAGVRTERRVDG
eukprot:5699502-Pleurochrysis_carterae.AAC.1